MIFYNVVHGGTDEDGNELDPRWMSVAITRELSTPFKEAFDECIWDRDTQSWYIPIEYRDRLEALIGSLSGEIAEYEKVRQDKIARDLEEELDLNAFKTAAQASIKSAAEKKRAPKETEQKRKKTASEILDEKQRGRNNKTGTSWKKGRI